MTLGKWISIGVGLITTLLVGGVLVAAPNQLVATIGSTALGTWVTAGVMGALLGLLHWIVMSKFDREVGRVASQIDLLSKDDDREVAIPSRLGMGSIARAVNQVITTFRQRIRQLTSRRRELEIQLRIAEVEQRHAASILNTISDAVIVTDPFNELAMINDAAARVLHLDASFARRRPIEQVIDDTVIVKLIKDAREGVAARPGFRRQIEHRFNREGVDQIYDVSVSGISDGLGEDELSAGTAKPNGQDAVGVVTVLRNVTRERQIADMKSDFVSSVSHELRTPLSSIKAYVEMLVDGEAHDEQTRLEFYNIIQGETNRLSRLIDNILNISRIESGVVRASREQVSLPTLMREAIDVMLPQARSKGIELKDLSAPGYFHVFADKDMIYQATLNLVSNAIKYTPEGGTVTVKIRADELARGVEVSVADTGVGIPPDDVPRLFAKFYRVDNHKRMAQGTGLGLNLVKQIIETVHGGKVSVSSELGKGSTFTYTLPLADGN
ncbi:MAG: ATP-binding protein [Phycisphaeraceae bacterium]